MKINKIEDIYPLTIISNKYGKYIILNCSSITTFVSTVEEVEIDDWETDMIQYFGQFDINYGIGESIFEAFEDYKNREVFENQLNRLK